jgi:hypothetical protein
MYKTLHYFTCNFYNVTRIVMVSRCKGNGCASVSKQKKVVLKLIEKIKLIEL